MDRKESEGILDFKRKNDGLHLANQIAVIWGVVHPVLQEFNQLSSSSFVCIYV